MSSPSAVIHDWFVALKAPLNSATAMIDSTVEELQQQEQTILNGTTFKRRGGIAPRRCTQAIQVGALTIIAGKTTPVLSSNQAEAFSCFMAMPIQGHFQTQNGSQHDLVCAGDVYIHQDYYRTSSIDYLSSLFFGLDRKRLERSLKAISGGLCRTVQATSILVPGQQRAGVLGTRGLWALMALIDTLHGEDPELPTMLGLDEQFYRLLSVALLEASGHAEALPSHRKQRWGDSSKVMDALVDYIDAHHDQPLSLTDLEEQSHYSGRQLQNLFQQHVGCSPMQYIRRQRLNLAMERLQQADAGSTLTSIARSIGYRCPSSFSREFQRQFGISPALVLREKGSRSAPDQGL